MTTGKTQKTAYQKFLEELHSRIIFPEDTFNMLIKEATGSNVERREKIFKGEANQVFDVLTKSGREVIVRISKQNTPQFLQEKWAMERCRKVGVPVAEILLLRHLELGVDCYSVCILNKIEGDTLERGALDMNQMSEEELRNIIHQAGEILAKIHSIKTEGFGRIDGEGRGPLSSFDQIIRQAVDKRADLMELADKHNFDKQIMEEIIEIIGKRAGKFKDIVPKLNHADFGPKHFMVKDGKLVGILDFGEAKSDSPVYDFAWWHFWFSDVNWSRGGKLFDWLKEGYSDKSLFNSDFEEIMHLIQLDLGLGVLNHYSHHKYLEGIEDAKKYLIRDYQFFNPHNTTQDLP